LVTDEFRENAKYVGGNKEDTLIHPYMILDLKGNETGELFNRAGPGVSCSKQSGGRRKGNHLGDLDDEMLQKS